MKIHFVYVGIILLLIGSLLGTALTPHFAIDRGFAAGLLIGIGATLLILGVLARKRLPEK